MKRNHFVKIALMIVLAGFLTLTSCKIEDLSSAKEESTDATTSGLQSQGANKQANDTVICCAETIQMQGTPPGKLKANFPCAVPAFVRVKGTTDVQKVTPSGNWISANTYPSTAVTLELLDANQNVVKECSYDSNGNIITSCFAEFGPVDANLTPPSILVVWTVNFQTGVTTFIVERSTDLDPNTGVGTFTAISGNLPVTQFSFDDLSPKPGNNWYRIVAKCGAGIASISEAVLAQ